MHVVNDGSAATEVQDQVSHREQPRCLMLARSLERKMSSTPRLAAIRMPGSCTSCVGVTSISSVRPTGAGPR